MLQRQRGSSYWRVDGQQEGAWPLPSPAAVRADLGTLTLSEEENENGSDAFLLMKTAPDSHL